MRLVIDRSKDGVVTVGAVVATEAEAAVAGATLTAALSQRWASSPASPDLSASVVVTAMPDGTFRLTQYVAGKFDAAWGTLSKPALDKALVRALAECAEAATRPGLAP